MDWISQNWVWVLFFAGMIAMHMFGHGGHEGHGGGCGGGHGGPKPATDDVQKKVPGHQH